jgi:glycosyltransferase involved in cell wall biosynthesis
VKVLLASKALVVGAYQRKLEELARVPDVDLIALVPPSWRERGHEIHLEPLHLEGYELIVSPIAVNGSFHLFFFPELPSILDRYRPDIVHFDEEAYNLATFLAVLQARRRSIPALFFTWQNLVRSYPPPFAWMEQYVFRAATGAIAGTASAHDTLRAKGYRGPIATIPQFGVDPERFTPCTEERRPGPFRIGFGGRLVPEKGVAVLVEACSQLARDFRLIILGAGPEEDAIRDRARQLGIEDQVDLVGALPSGEMPGRIQNLDVVVLPSLSQPNWIEQFGRILVEAMACEVPVIGSTCGEIPQVVGDAGSIVPEGDANALAGAIDRMASDPNLRAELGRRGRERVLRDFTHARVAERTMAIYREIYARSARPSPAVVPPTP